jgi:glycosyltransferase involved in cell wall biosynthesis
MRIAIFAWESLHSKSVGGIAPHVSELAAALARRGLEVHVFTRGGEGQPGYEEIYGVRYHRVTYDESGDDIQKMENMSNAMVWSFGETTSLIGQFDVAAAHDWMTCKAMVQCKNTYHLPCVFTFHSTEPGRTLGKPKGPIMMMESEATFVADRIIAVSKNLHGEITHNYKVDHGKVWVIHNGIQCHHYDGHIDCGEVKGRYGIGPLDPCVLFVGRMTGGLKGADLLCEAVPNILGMQGNAKFIFVGDGDAKMHCDHRANEMGVGHACRFLGTKSGQELIDLYKACDVVCIPSRNEPFGLTVLEAWAAGKPVVVSDQVGCPVKHGEEGYVVSCTSEGVAWGVKELFANFDHARYLGQKGRTKAAFGFSWDTVAEQTEACYRDVVHFVRPGATPGCTIS